MITILSKLLTVLGTNPGQTPQKSTPGTPPTSYAAAVISGPSAHQHRPQSQQNSPQVQPINHSPSLGPIGSPASSSGNPNISFGMMLPPLHHSANTSVTNGSGSSSLNNSTHGSVGSQSQSQSLFNHLAESNTKKLAVPTPHLLQHQEQFPPPTSPLRSMTANYPVHDQSQFPQYPSPNSLTARGRAYTESYLFVSQKSSLPFSLQHMTFSPSPDLPYPALLPSNLDSNLDDPVQQVQGNPNADHLLSNSAWGSTNKNPPLSTTNRESQLENLFVPRQDIERSVSLSGALGWMPSSLSHDPPESRRGFSDLGIGLGLGRENQFGFDHNSPNTNQPPPFVPSMSAWESFVDGSMGSSNQPTHHGSPARPHSFSLNHLHDGISPSSRLHPPSPMGSSVHHSVHSTGSNSVFSTHDGDDDNTYHIQELRLQAPEYNPNAKSSPTWFTR